MTPSWKFSDGTRPQHLAHPFYIQPWPEDLPDRCGVCGTEFRFGFNLTIGPGKVGRLFKSLAYWMVLPSIPLAFVIVSYLPGFVAGRSGGFGILLLMVLPPATFTILSKIMPISRWVECKKCGWNHDYKIRVPAPIEPASAESQTIQAKLPQDKPSMPIPILKTQTVMLPNWKFRSVPGKYTAQPWPDDLPSQCGICGTKFRSGFNLSIGPGRLGRKLRKSAYIGILPFIAIAFILPFIFPNAFQDLSDKGFIAWLVGAMLFPPMLLAGLAMVMPQSRLVECKECGWSDDYKISEPAPLPPAS